MSLMGVHSSYPKFTLGQFLVLISLACVMFGIWFDPCESHRGLLGRTDSLTRIAIGRHSPVAAIYDHDWVRVLDCRTQMTILNAAIPTLARRELRQKWSEWPEVSCAGAPAWNNLGLGSIYGQFSPDDRFLVISLQERYGARKFITILEIETGRQATWKGEKESIYASAKFKPGVVEIERYDQKLFEFSGARPDTNDAWFCEGAIDKESLKMWTPKPRENSGYEVEYVSERVDCDFLDDQSNRCLLWTWDSLAQPESTQLCEVDTGAYLPLKRPFHAETCFIVDELVPNSNLVKGTLRGNTPDRLAIEDTEVCWNVDTGELTKVPDRYGCQIARHAGRLLICDNNQELFWLDPATGARQTIYTARRFSGWREIGMLLGGIIGMLVMKPTTEKDYSPRLILITAIAATLALLPPAFAYEYYGGLNRTSEHVVSLASLIVILSAAIGALIQRTASLPTIGASLLFVAILIGPWIGMHTQEQHSSSLLSYVTNWPDPDFEPEVNDFDILRPWRAQKPDPGKAKHVEYLDRLEVIEVEP